MAGINKNRCSFVRIVYSFSHAEKTRYFQRFSGVGYISASFQNPYQQKFLFIQDV